MKSNTVVDSSGYQDPEALNLAVTMRLIALNINQALGSQSGIAENYGRLVKLYGLRGDLERAEQMLCMAVET